MSGATQRTILSATENLGFSFEEHFDLSDAVEQTGKSLDTNYVMPTERERRYRLNPKQAAELGIWALSTSLERDPILGHMIATGAIIEAKSSQANYPIRLHYRAGHDMWGIQTPGTPKQGLRPATSSSIAQLLIDKHLPADSLPSSLLDNPSPSGQDILHLLEMMFEQRNIRPEYEHSAHTFDWPTKSTFANGECDATMLYEQTRKNNQTRRLLSATCALAMSRDHNKPNLSVTTSYTVLRGRRARRAGAGNVTLRSNEIPEDQLQRLARIEADSIVDHYDRLRLASRNLGAIARLATW